MNQLTWSEEEITLLLDFHFRFRMTSLNQNHKAVAELSDTLKYINRENKISKEVLNDRSFRSTDSIIIKRRAIKELDSNTTRKTKHSKLDYTLWSRYNNCLSELKQSSIKIRAKYNIPTFLKNIGYLFPICEENYEYITLNVKETNASEISVLEGKSKLRIHYLKERNQNIVSEKKILAIAKYGKLECEVCDFDFHEKYGEIGKDFIECHHLIPLSQLTKQEIVLLEDLALVCSNCHRMIHRNQTILNINQLIELIAQQK